MKKTRRYRYALRDNPHRLEWLVWGAMTVAVVLLLFTQLGSASSEPVISDDILRLHVVANSDSEQDQAVKLEIRDALQSEFATRWDVAPNGEICRQWAERDQETMEDYVNSLLKSRGVHYQARVEIGVFEFPDRVYEDAVELPQGRYHAVRVMLGDGAGKNWWCVLYPPLCLPDSEGVIEDGEKGQPLEVRSWIFEQLPISWQDCLKVFWIGRNET